MTSPEERDYLAHNAVTYTEWPLYTIDECDVKATEMDCAFERSLAEENRAERIENLRRQESRNISMKARGDNHYRKTHCAQIKARKGWR